MRSVDVFGIEDLDAGARDDPDVEQEAPVADVPEIMLDAAPHLVDLRRLAAKPLTCAQPVMPGLTCWRIA